MTPEDLESLMKSALEYDYIRFTYADLCGAAKGEYVPRRNVAQFLRKGIGINNGIITAGPMSESVLLPELEAFQNDNGLLMPESKTPNPVPWAGHGKYKVGEILSEMHWIDGSPQEACPRTVARKQLQKLADHGFALKAAFEMEFVLEHAQSGLPVWDGVDSFNHKLVTQQEEILFQIDQQLLACGVPVEKLRAEHAPGQYEMSLIPQFGIKAVDDAFIFKQGVKEMAQQRGLLANFMSIPRLNYLGTGAHFNHSLWTADMQQSVFFDSANENNISDICRWWIGGLCKHAPALTALFSPTVNCYRRLHRPFTPDRANWNIENRRGTFRVKNQSPSGFLIENRIPSGTSNAYLVLAGTVAAGLDGIINKIPCPKEYDTEARVLPFTLQEAIYVLQADMAIKEALGPEFIRWFVECKKQVDLKKLGKSDPNKDDPVMLDAERKMYSLYI